MMNKLKIWMMIAVYVLNKSNKMSKKYMYVINAKMDFIIIVYKYY